MLYQTQALTMLLCCSLNFTLKYMFILRVGMRSLFFYISEIHSIAITYPLNHIIRKETHG